MRTEKEMFDLILGVAKANERVRAVLMNGSRANPNVPKDIYQDYDIAYIVTDVESFTKDHNWINVFGKRVMLQMPEAMRNPSNDGHFVYLMLFKDGNRIDLSFVPINQKLLGQYDCLTMCLLDKDGIVPSCNPPTDKDFHIKVPTELFYFSCCNNFWWCMQNVAKGIARDELPYAMEMYHYYVRDELNDMVQWYIGTQTEFSVSSGKMGKYFKKYLPKDLYNMYTKTYSDSDYNNLWSAIFTACELFRTIAPLVAEYCGSTYNQDEDRNMIEYLIRVKAISRIANSIAPCGLVCNLCHLADSCDGCRSEANCCASRKTAEGCYQYNCCNGKGIDGCWECDIAPCDKGMFSESHDVRLRAFIQYIKENGKDKLAERLYFNAQEGIHYGHGKDYDNLGSIDAVIKKLESL